MRGAVHPFTMDGWHLQLLLPSLSVWGITSNFLFLFASPTEHCACCQIYAMRDTTTTLLLPVLACLLHTTDRWVVSPTDRRRKMVYFENSVEWSMSVMMGRTVGPQAHRRGPGGNTTAKRVCVFRACGCSCSCSYGYGCSCHCGGVCACGWLCFPC